MIYRWQGWIVVVFLEAGGRRGLPPLWPVNLLHLQPQSPQGLTAKKKKKKKREREREREGTATKHHTLLLSPL